MRYSEQVSWVAYVNETRVGGRLLRGEGQCQVVELGNFSHGRMLRYRNDSERSTDRIELRSSHVKGGGFASVESRYRGTANLLF